jgi:hypothetical protein
MITRHHDEPRDLIVSDISQYRESFAGILKAIKDRPGENLGPEFREALGVFSMSVAGHLDKKQTLHLLSNLASIGIANFEFGMKPGEKLTVNLDGESFEITGQPVTAYMDTDTWLSAFFSAVVSRNGSGIRTLCQVPEPIHKNANLKPDRFDLAFVRAMKGLYNPEANIGQLLVDVMEASAPDALDKDRSEYASSILLPQLPLYRCILSSDQDEFNEKLEQAVSRHKDYWGKKERRFSKEGWMALPLMAAGSMAFDSKGFEMTFETDYLPSWLVRGEF